MRPEWPFKNHITRKNALFHFYCENRFPYIQTLLFLKLITLIWKFRYDICVINLCQKLLYNSPRTVSEEALTLPVASESTLRAIVYVQFTRGGGGRGGAKGTWVNFCWVCAAGLSEPLPHYSLFFCGQL